MRAPIAALILAASAVAALAQSGLDAPPDLKGVWKGEFAATVFGANKTHAGSAALSDPPRISTLAWTYEFTGQEGRALWGEVWSDPADKEPVAFAFSIDNGTLLGADLDGYHRLTIVSPTRLEACFTMSAASGSGTIVATCGILDKQ